MGKLERLPRKNSRSAWARSIKVAWQKSVSSILETGHLLIAAKEGPNKLPHGEFLNMIRLDLPFTPRTAQMLMRIAKHPVLSNAKFISYLPASWGTLYELATLEVPEEELKKMLKDGTIKAETTGDEVKKLAEQIKENGVYWWARVRDAFEVLIRFSDEHNSPDDLSQFVEHVYEMRVWGTRVHRDLDRLSKWISDVNVACQDKLSSEGHEMADRSLFNARMSLTRKRKPVIISPAERNRRGRVSEIMRLRNGG